MSLFRSNEQSAATTPQNRASASHRETLRIGELARITGEKVKTLRYWADRGLLIAGRGENNYRTFDPNALGRVAFIRNAQSLGLKLGAVSQLLAFAEEQQLPCKRVEVALIDHLTHVRREIAALQECELRVTQLLASANTQPCSEQEEGRYLPL